MKKFFVLLFICVCIDSFRAQSCEGTSVLNENFSNGIPASWTIYNQDANTLLPAMISKGFTGAFQPRVHNGEHCAACAAEFSPPGQADDYLVSPAITLGAGPFCLSWKAGGEYSFFSEAYDILISSSSSLSSVSAGTIIFSQTAEQFRWNEHSIDLSAYAGQTIFISFHYKSNNQYAIFLDDIRVSQPTNNDLRVTSVSVQDVISPGTQLFSGTILNGGLNSVTSFILNWKINNGVSNSMSMNALIIPPSGYALYNHNIPWNPSANGTYTLKIWTNFPNGNPDQNPGNDTLTKTIYVNTIAKNLLIEEFTQASCPPCGFNNPAFDSLVMPNLPQHQVSLIKYQCSWPGYDPMNLFNPTDVADRVKYYGVTGIPHGYLNGAEIIDNCGNGYDGSISCLKQNDIDSCIALPTIFRLDVSGTLSGNNYNVIVTLQSMTDFSAGSFVLRTVVVEDSVDYNGTPPGTNGETLFRRTMRKILPDDFGVNVPALLSGQTFTQSFFYSIPAGPVPAALMAVAFVQEENSQRIFQSATSDFPPSVGIKNEEKNNSSLRVFPNPTKNTIYFYWENSLEKTANLSLFDVNGKEIQKINLAAGKNELNINGFSEGIYFYRAVSSDGKIIAGKIVVGQ